MPEIILLLFFLLPIWIMPVMTAYYASAHGRSFKRWLIIGFLLPVISFFIVIILPDKSKEKVSSN